MGSRLSREPSPQLVLVGGGPGAGKSSLILRCASLDPAWREDASEHPSDQTFVLNDAPRVPRVRMIEVPCDEQAKSDLGHPFARLFSPGVGTRWSDISAVVWVVDASSSFDARSVALADMRAVCCAGIAAACPLAILVNRSGEARSGRHIHGSVVERAVTALSPVLEACCESHSDSPVQKTAADGTAFVQSARDRRPWSVWSVPEYPPEDGARGSLVMPLSWLQMALARDVNVRLFTQRLKLPGDRDESAPRCAAE
jgi:hypothetical protein